MPLQTNAFKLWLILSAFASIALVPAHAHAQTSSRDTVEFDATTGTPIIDVEIEDQSFRFALDPLLGPFVTINPDARDRVPVRNVKAEAISAKLDGAEIKGSLAKIKLKAGYRSHTVEAALINRDHFPGADTEPYDMAGGFEALPGHFIVVHLNKGLTGPMKEITFQRARSDPRAGFPIGIAETPMRINVHFANPVTWLDRRAAEALINEGLMEPTGEVSRISVWYGLQMPVQKITSTRPITIKGLALKNLQARTGEALILPEADENVIIVQRSRRGQRPPNVLLGIETLRQCAKMVFDKRKRRLTLTCPA